MRPAFCSAPPRLFAFGRSKHTFRCACCLLLIAMLLAAPGAANADIRAEAYRGQPFGIGRVSIDLPRDASPASDDRFRLVESDDRLLYPVVERRGGRPVRRLLRSFINIETPSRATFYFMFVGDEPLRLSAYAPNVQQISVEPQNDPEEYHELLDEWWEASSDRFQEVFRKAEYPVLVENYLTATWARRLDREMPSPSREVLGRFRVGAPWVSQLLANEAYQAQVEREMLLGRFGDQEEATLPLSALRDVETARSDDADELPAPAAPAGEIESIARHVPQECFYLRFGNFPNYLWFRDFLRHWQGDLGNMIVMQCIDYDNSERFQQQIAVGESKLARVMGPAVIRDVAIIGFDTYLRDGAAMGILFEANNSALLGRNLGRQRQEAKAQHENVTEETLRIAGQDVSYVSSADGRLRSYYVVDGDFHLIANNRRLVERFLEAGDGTESLAGSAEFQEARAVMPLARGDTIFLFASSSFFQHIAGPHYRIELDRRLRSIGEMRALKLAQFAARAERIGARSVGELIDAELLPVGFAQRSDESELVEVSENEGGQGEADYLSLYRDSLRGQPGWMTPIPDVPVERITPAEASRYAEFRRGLQSSVGGFAPISVALKRAPSAEQKGWDRITADVRIAPYSQMPIGRWPDMLGPAATMRVAPIAGDVASLELVAGALGEPVHLFGGLRDFRTPLAVREGEVRSNVPASEFVRAYVGSWPRPHLLDRFLGRPADDFDDEGIARATGLFDLWLRRADDFFLFSFNRDVLLEVGRQLAMVEADSPAQVRLHVEDLHNKQVADAVSALGYMRGRDASASGSRFMNALITQLHVPEEDARAVAESLIAGTFDCPLGGEYVLADPSGEREFARDGDSAPVRAGRLWISTAPAPENRFLLTVIPADYTMPLMNWFRGIDAHVARIEDEITLHAELDMVRIEVGPPEDPEEADGTLKIPSLENLFSGFSKKDDKAKPAAASEDEPDSTE